jgi:DNA ligase-1
VLDGEVLAAAMAGCCRSVRCKSALAAIIRAARSSLTPVIFLAYDLLELAGEDCSRPLHQRRQELHGLLYSLRCPDPRQVVLQLSDIVRAPSWETLAQARQQSRARGTEGLMLKRRESAYGVGRTRGDWWKWKVDALTIDCVRCTHRFYGARQPVHRLHLCVWSLKPCRWQRSAMAGGWKCGSNSALVRRPAQNGWRAAPAGDFAKAYSGLSDSEIAEVDAFIRRNTLEKFGPVRTVKPGLVFELAFEGIQRSARHKSGVAVRFPRMARIRRDKKIEEADSLETILHMLDTMAAP